MKQHEFTVQDIEYRRDENGPLLARTYIPTADGTYPLVVELHGGGWCLNDRVTEHHRHEALARSGIAVMSLDFRQGAQGPYPAALQDINYAIRWAKANSQALKTSSDQIGLVGQSSGGHLAVLAAMRPNDLRYGALEVPNGAGFDAKVRCVAASWPVISPSSRYLYLKAIARGDVSPRVPIKADLVIDLIARHEVYWGSLDAMREGNPLLALLRREKANLPPLQWLQPHDDPMHDYLDAEYDGLDREPTRFADLYSKSGGSIELEYVSTPLKFTYLHPNLPEASAAFDKISGFLHRHLGQ